MQKQLETADTRLREQAEELESQSMAARTDALTELPNRRAFDETARRLLATFKRTGRPFSIVMIDVDRFKSFNDTHGHQVGDIVLQSLGDVLRKTSRDMDMPARFGGEEFCIVLPESEARAAAQAAERVRAALEATVVKAGGKDLQVTASFGVAEVLAGEDVESLIRRADQSLYQAKESGRNRVHWHDGAKIRPLFEQEDLADVDLVVDQEATVAEASGENPPAAQAPPTKESAGAKHPTYNGKYKELIEVLTRRLSEWNRGGVAPALMLLQIDNLQTIRMANGDRAGVIVLETVRKFLGAAVRDMDHLIPCEDNTFAVLLPGAGLKNATQVAMRLQEAIAGFKLPLEDETIQFTVSIGVAQAANREDAIGLLRRTDESVTSANNLGGNCCFLHNGEYSELASAETLERAELIQL